MIKSEQLHEQVLSRIDLTNEQTDEELLEIIHSVLEENSRRQFIPLKEKAALGKELFNAFRKLDILQELIEEEKVEMPDYVTISVNDEFVDSDARNTTVLKDGDNVEFLYFMGGGC